MSNKTSRRDFFKTSAAIGAAVWVAPKPAWTQEKSANSRVRYACIGVDGKGGSDSADAAKHGDIVAICDVDESKLAKAAGRPGFTKARTFRDWRVMLSSMYGKIDAVTVSTPDHMHAPATAMAMKMGIACYTQKPLTHTVWEARRLAEIAKEMKVATQMGNQGTSENGLREAAAILKKGTLGRIKEVHVVTDRPIWPQGGDRPEPADVPANLDWDLWLGPAPERPYAPVYHPFAWRGWWDFGTGALGDMACHTFNMPYAGLNLADPKSIQAWCSGHNKDSYPQSSKIKFEFTNPSGDGLMDVWWYDGGNLPDESLLNGQKFTRKNSGAATGAIIVGEEFTLYSPGDYAADFWLIDKDGKTVPKPEVEWERSPGHFTEFHQAITGEREQAMSNFPNYAGKLTETILLGNLAVFVAAGGEGKKVEWDAEKLSSPNSPEVASIVKKEYRGSYGEILDA